MKAKNTVRPLCAALFLALGVGFAPTADAVLAPNVADTFYLPALGAQQPNNAQLPVLKVALDSTALLKFDLSSLPPGALPEDVERAVLILAVQKAVEHGGVDVHLVVGPSQWSEVSGVQLVNLDPLIMSRALCKSVEGHEHFVTIDVTDAVKFWLGNPNANFGIALKPAAIFPNTVMEFDSREYNAFSPILDIQMYPGDGFIGARGPAGPAGPAGPVGPEGPRGWNGAVGPKGDAGVPGPAGATGPIGLTGPPGAAGPAGAIGAIGPVGPIGPIGFTGPQGAAGPAGAIGAIGPAGPIGPIGLTGPQGIAGVPGPVGPIGLTGPQGIAGPAGPIGLPGAQGPAGAPGAQGPAGPAGAMGLPGPAGAMGPAGPAGPPGETGPQGISVMGPPGPVGPQGPPGSILGSVYTRVAQYVDWERGNATVFCDAGDVALGGGAVLDETNPKNLHTSAPVGSPPTGWVAGYGSKATFWVFAVCAK